MEDGGKYWFWLFMKDTGYSDIIKVILKLTTKTTYKMLKGKISLSSWVKTYNFFQKQK